MNAPAVHTDSTAKRVIVGCKLPNGLHLDVKQRDGDKIRVTLAGANAQRIIGGYGMTHNVDADFMAKWFAQNAKHPAVINKEIFIHGDEASAHAIAKEQREIKTGLDAIDPVTNGMLNNADGEVDKKELKKFRQAQAENPRAGRQIQE